MGKKNNNETSGNKGFTKFCAYWALAIAAFTYLFGGLLNLIIETVNHLSSATAASLRTASEIVTLLGTIALVVAVALPAHGYVRGKKKIWKIIYWIALSVFVLGVVFNLI